MRSVNDSLVGQVRCLDATHADDLEARHVASSVRDFSISQVVRDDSFDGSVAGFVPGFAASLVADFVAIHEDDYLADCSADSVAVLLASLVAGSRAGSFACLAVYLDADLVVSVFVCLISSFPVYFHGDHVVDFVANLFPVLRFFLAAAYCAGSTPGLVRYPGVLSAGSNCGFVTFLGANSRDDFLVD